MPAINDIKALIFAEVGVGLEGDDAIDQILLDKVSPLWETIWARWQCKAYWGGLQELYAKKSCLEILSGQLRDLVNAQLGSDLKLTQSSLMGNVQVLYNNCIAEIAREELLAQGQRGAVVGRTRREGIIERRYPWEGDPNSTVYRGNPLAPPVTVNGVRYP